MPCSLQSLLVLTMSLSSGENSRQQQGSEGAHLLLGSQVLAEHNQEVASSGSISLAVWGFKPTPDGSKPSGLALARPSPNQMNLQNKNYERKYNSKGTLGLYQVSQSYL